MNEQSQKILADLLKKASDGIDSAVAFSQAQIPDVVHQLLVWKFASSLLTQALILGLLITMTIILYRGISSRGAKVGGQRFRGSNYEGRSFFWDSDGDLSFAGFMFTFAFFIATAFCLMIFACNFDWLKIWLAPKLYLIEYATSLVK